MKSYALNCKQHIYIAQQQNVRQRPSKARNCRSLTGLRCAQSIISLNVHCVRKNVYHPTANDNFNSSCPITIIFGTNITEEYTIERWFNFPPYCVKV